jgi:hypothetical protein
MLEEDTVFDPSMTRANSYRGNAVYVFLAFRWMRVTDGGCLDDRQQAISGLTKLPPGMFKGLGKVFTTLGMFTIPSLFRSRAQC